jgi:hypothetical protein
VDLRGALDVAEKRKSLFRTELRSLDSQALGPVIISNYFMLEMCFWFYPPIKRKLCALLLIPCSVSWQGEGIAFLFKLPPSQKPTGYTRTNQNVCFNANSKRHSVDHVYRMYLFYDTVVNEGGWVDGQVAGVYCGDGVVNKHYVKPENAECSYT